MLARRLRRIVQLVLVLGALAAVIFVMFDLHIFEHVVILWPTHVVELALGTLLVLVMVGAPLVALVTREPTDSLPTATDRSGSR